MRNLNEKISSDPELGPGFEIGRIQERDVTRLNRLESLSTVQDLLGKLLAGGVNHWACFAHRSIQRLGGVRFDFLFNHSSCGVFCHI